MPMQLSETSKQRIIIFLKWETVILTAAFTTNQGLLVYNFWMERLHSLEDGSYFFSGACGLMTWLQVSTFVSAFGVESCNHVFDPRATKLVIKTNACKTASYVWGAVRWILSLNKALTFGGLGMLACETVAKQQRWAFLKAPGVEYTYGAIGIICNISFFFRNFATHAGYRGT